ncbi:MAG: TonB family protein [Betaproteobacteria bacterium]|nr:TonB family protein [Betaproteobacteria bacterium]MDE2622353.1 TonB family protein [Betaproteobacteria bacterium]
MRTEALESVFAAVPEKREGWLSSFGLALTVELVLLAAVTALVFLVQTLHPPTEAKAPVAIQLAEVPPEPKPTPPEPPRPVQKTPLPRKVVPVPVPQPTPVQQPVKAAEPSPFAEKSRPATPPAPPAPAQPSPDLLADYMAKVRAAVQAALVYPESASEMQFTGRARVEFRLSHGVQSSARIIVSSGFRVFDRAALLAVRDAQYPQPPAAMTGESRLFQVWVEFRS